MGGTGLPPYLELLVERSFNSIQIQRGKKYPDADLTVAEKTEPEVDPVGS
jgi:hypothetical protein